MRTSFIQTLPSREVGHSWRDVETSRSKSSAPMESVVMPVAASSDCDKGIAATDIHMDRHWAMENSTNTATDSNSMKPAIILYSRNKFERDGCNPQWDGRTIICMDSDLRPRVGP